MTGTKSTSRACRTHGHYCAPILFDGALLGVLNLYLDAHHQQTPEELQFITAAAHAVGGMIQRHQAEQQLRYHAYHDGLTRMPNRTLFMDRLEQCLRFGERHPALRCAVLYLDLDRFKTINDSLGHTLGDQLLLEVSGRIRTCVRPEDTVARMGGDEFTILLEDVVEPADALRVADRLHTALQPPDHARRPRDICLREHRYCHRCAERPRCDRPAARCRHRDVPRQIPGHGADGVVRRTHAPARRGATDAGIGTAPGGGTRGIARVLPAHCRGKLW